MLNFFKFNINISSQFAVCVFGSFYPQHLSTSIHTQCLFNQSHTTHMALRNVRLREVEFQPSQRNIASRMMCMQWYLPTRQSIYILYYKQCCVKVLMSRATNISLV